MDLLQRKKAMNKLKIDDEVVAEPTEMTTYGTPSMQLWKHWWRMAIGLCLFLVFVVLELIFQITGEASGWQIASSVFQIICVLGIIAVCVNASRKFRPFNF